MQRRRPTSEMTARNAMVWLVRMATGTQWRELGRMFGTHGETARSAAVRVECSIDREILKLTIERNTDPPWVKRLRKAGAIGLSEPTGYNLSRRLVHSRHGDVPDEQPAHCDSGIGW